MAGPENEFIERSRALEAAYLSTDDTIEQSGFSGGRQRWVAERSPLVEAIDRDGSLLDVGCANGLLAQDVASWADGRGFRLIPHGIDLGAGLVQLAKARIPEHSHNFLVADAWTWEPGRRWTFVYSLLDLSPEELWCQWLGRLLGWVVPGGRLIIGSYGSSSRSIAPVDPAMVMSRCGLPVVGSSEGGDPVVTRFAWSAGLESDV